MKKILQTILENLAYLYLARYKPVIVGVTGNVGKTSTKEAIAAVLGAAKRTRSSGGNLNNELGLPLTITGDWAQEYYRSGGGAGFWAKALLLGIWRLMVPHQYPEVLVLEYAADRPGDIKKLVRMFKPHLGVVTAVGETPVHVEFFASPKEIAAEKSQLVRVLEPSGRAILNFDDLTVLEMKDVTRAQVRTFGFGEGADVQISNFDLSMDEQGRPQGCSFKLHAEGSFVPVKIYGSLGRSQAMAAAAAAAVGLNFGMNLVQISDALSHYRGPAGRLRILKGVKDSVILDDTYNAAPASMHLALETFKNIVALRQAQGKTVRAVAVLGDMLELGRFSVDAHRTVGDMAGSIADILVCVGARAKLIADSSANQMPQDNILTFDTSNQAKAVVQDIIRPGDMVLVKGSQGIRMEKIVQEIMAEPERKEELLVRQSKKWQNK